MIQDLDGPMAAVPMPVPRLCIPGAVACDGNATQRDQSCAAVALATARSARESGQMTARTELRPESTAMATPRGGRDGDERRERSDGAADNAKDAPPTSRRRKAGDGHM